MCLTVPARVVGRDGDGVIVEVAGRLRRAASFVTPDVEPGEWCLVGMGAVLDRLTEAEAIRLATDLASIAEPITDPITNPNDGVGAADHS